MPLGRPYLFEAWLRLVDPLTLMISCVQGSVRFLLFTTYNLQPDQTFGIALAALG